MIEVIDANGITFEDAQNACMNISGILYQPISEQANKNLEELATNVMIQGNAWIGKFIIFICSKVFNVILNSNLL